MRFVSVLGKFYPAKEVVQVPVSMEEMMGGKTGIYTGADRAAINYMIENGHCEESESGTYEYSGEEPQHKGKRWNIVSYPGRDYRTEPDLIRQSRELGFKSVDEYLNTMHGVDVAALREKAEKTLSVVKPHDGPVNRSNDKSDMGGGYDTSGNGKSRKGGFDEPKDVAAVDLKKRA